MELKAHDIPELLFRPKTHDIEILERSKAFSYKIEPFKELIFLILFKIVKYLCVRSAQFLYIVPFSIAPSGLEQRTR
jgi:hypothetical protein